MTNGGFSRARLSTWLPAIVWALAPAREHRPPAGDAPGERVDSQRRTLAQDYVLVGANGAIAFDVPPVGLTGSPTSAPTSAAGVRLGKGFGFLATGETRNVGGRRYIRIHDGRWLLDGEISHVRPSRFVGARLAPGEALRFGWVVARAATVHAAADAGSAAVVTRPRLTRLALTGPCRKGFCPLVVGWVRAQDLSVPTVAARPAAVGPREAWIDVDLSSQTLVAYQGDEPRFATLVSTGIGGPGSPLATPTGVFRIRSKHEMVRMDNLEHTGVEPYAYDVPLTQYFNEGKALHAALWHDQFGHPRSHGCINLSPEDARWLFGFTAPTLGPGAGEVAATVVRPGSVVRVRGRLPDDRGRAAIADAGPAWR
jgi:L,D-transpeptidase catalytic domain